jgi:hypothetical protein
MAIEQSTVKVLGGLFCCLLLAGCATKERTSAAAAIAVADAAVNDAVAADTARLASGDIDAARKALNDAGAAMKMREYERARLYALQAETDARLARARTSANDALSAATALDESTRLLRDELGRPRQ